MKILLTLMALISLSTHAFAQGAPQPQPPKQLKVTSFYPLNGSRGASELCGTVIGKVEIGDRIEVVADPKHQPGHYMTLPAPNGKFCTMLVSVTGRADVNLISSNPVETVSVEYIESSSRFIGQ